MISIITTVKNGSKYILETLESIKNQTFNDFEHIVVDDGSTDDTIEILNQFQKNNPNYRLLVFQPGNLGRGKALNFAVKKAHFNWIAVIDADDLWHPEKLNMQYQVIIDNPQLGLLATKSAVFSNSADLNFEQEIISHDFILVEKTSLLYVNSISHSSVLIKKEFAQYDITRKSQLDYELWLRMSYVQGASMAILSSVLNYHRIHENQSFESKGGKMYRWRAFKIKAYYCCKYFKVVPLVYGTLKFLGTLILPRKTRLNISQKNERKNI